MASRCTSMCSRLAQLCIQFHGHIRVDPFTSLFAEIVTSFATAGRKQESPFRSQLTSNINKRAVLTPYPHSN